MKKIKTFLLIIFAAIFFLSGCTKAQEPDTIKKLAQLTGKNILTVYLSRTNNTKAVAEIVQSFAGGKLSALEVENPYPEDYDSTVQQVTRENETSYLPPLKTKIDSIEIYDIIFIGFPTWGMKLPPPMKTFLTQYDLSGKTIIPFNTHAGFGKGSSFETVKELCKDSEILEGYSTEGGSERDGELFVIEGEKRVETQTEIQKWLRRIKLIED